MECINPIFLKKVGFTVRCGKCEPCIEHNVLEWAVRLQSEYDKCLTAYYIDLTFNDEHVKKYPKLDKSQFQRFLKRLMNFNTRGVPKYAKSVKVSKIKGKHPKIKYFATGEYGTKFFRPHWHLILINFPYNQIDTEKLIDLAWNESDVSIGFDKCGYLKEGGIFYVVDYLFKNLKKDSIKLKSNNIGESYITKNRVDYHQKKQEGSIRLRNMVYPMPRYIRQKVYTPEQRKQIGEKARDFIIEQNLMDPYLQEKNYKNLLQKIEFKKQKRL